MAQIELKNVTFTYPDAPAPALSSVNLSIERGQFVVLLGSSGSGKSTLLRLLKEEIRPHGRLEGTIDISGTTSSEMGFVFQDPENQIVADDPLHEMVFGLENRGLATSEMRSRVAEIVSFFGAEPILHKKMHELSGGKKQQMNLASVLLMQPDVLLLDEPASQLDPVSTRELLDMLKRLNEEFGMTIVLAEHRLEEIITLADQVVMMENGRIIYDDPPREVMKELWKTGSRAFVPDIPALFLQKNSSEATSRLPLSIKEGRGMLGAILQKNEQEWPELYPDETRIRTNSAAIGRNTILTAKNASFRYDRKNGTVIEDLHFSLGSGELYALLGGNGSGKSTLLKLLCGVLKPEAGNIMLNEKPLKKWKTTEVAARIAYLPQNPKLFFLHDTVRGEMEAACRAWGTKMSEADRLAEEFGIDRLLDQHPYDLSGGELQKAAFVCLLLKKPDILLLDEPTKGLDPVSKENLAAILREWKGNGAAILISTHDIEFAAKYADRCGMLFQGNITSEGSPDSFFNGNFFYTPILQRLYRNLGKTAISNKF
ncbi:ATP-binding cassette domain-containing protein [Neobacillus notoginsengisoli]|uniref:ATP-binding cassette domain-containing protein n=1 Tax=Neobacillus notoginsengisoli TaxID=1578198 RepID=A0A417YY46_9BACI|nr:ABC transporter ATP-binding protein [Neobacillus notoginsengisoli]RHW42575.1 ATP-binding cassette domain-containing protein [Neobacillus notoginsengisoli]